MQQYLRRQQSTAMHIFNQRLNGTIDLNESDRNIGNNYRIAQSAGNNLMVDYEGIDPMVSMRSDGKIKWLQELGPIVKQSLDVFDGPSDPSDDELLLSFAW